MRPEIEYRIVVLDVTTTMSYADIAAQVSDEYGTDVSEYDVSKVFKRLRDEATETSSSRAFTRFVAFGLVGENF